MKRDGTEPLDACRKPQRRKKQYTPPRLTPHGDAHELTRALAGSGDDGQSGSQPFDER